MIEFLLRRFPVNQVEVRAIVLEVTAHTILPVWILHFQLKVIAVLVGKVVGNFLMAAEALERGSASAENVAGIALGVPGQRGVRPGQRARGNLGR